MSAGVRRGSVEHVHTYEQEPDLVVHVREHGPSTNRTGSYRRKVFIFFNFLDYLFIFREKRKEGEREKH